MKTFDRLGISLDEQKALAGVAVDFVMDSVSVATSFKDKLSELGLSFVPLVRLFRNTLSSSKSTLEQLFPLQIIFSQQ